MMYFVVFFLQFPIKCFSMTLYTQRFGLENNTYTNATVDNCQLPNIMFSFNATFNFTLNNCKVNKCHAIIDKSFDMKWGNCPTNINPSAFYTVSITGARYLHKSAGITFIPTQSTINILLQTHTCHDFYTIHPFETTENCNNTLPISNVIRGLPLCNDID